MNEYLKVNSKTDILEFKRKHNLLVENGIIKANVSNIKTLSNDVINNLRCGDVVLKEDSSGKHAYLVSFKSDTGLCLTYCDASCVETQSYDKVENNWVYNSEDKWEMTKPIYCHPIRCYLQTGESEIRFMFTCLIFNNSDTSLTLNTFKEFIDSLPTNAALMCSGYYKDSTTEITSLSYLSKSGVNYLFDGGRYSQNNYSRKIFSWNDIFGDVNVSFSDGANKIN